MALLPTQLDAVTMFVADRQRAKEFYTAVFGVAPLLEDETSVAFGFGDVAVNLLVRTSAAELVEPATVGAPDGGVQFVLTVGVPDTDAVCAELARLGVPVLNGPVDRPWGLRTASFTDPDGHVWEVAHRIRERDSAG
jgi:catechol 2,3-dioxygenase-like lactoylglutathione lyase family enzyme